MKEISIKDLKNSPAAMFDDNWALVTARKKDGSFNMCTISWGSLGELWSKDVCTIYLKPIRFTDSFVDEDDYFTVCFFNKEYRKDLGYLGTHSGKDENKLVKTNLHASEIENGISYKEANLVIVCKKIYKGQFKLENFIDSDEIKKTYYEKEEPHNMYVGEIVKVFSED